jgi:hypothetical protein
MDCNKITPQSVSNKKNDLRRGKMIAFSRELDLKLTLLHLKCKRLNRYKNILFDVPLLFSPWHLIINDDDVDDDGDDE